MAEELRSLKTPNLAHKTHAGDNTASSRSSIESSRVTSPAGRGRTPGTSTPEPSNAGANIDFVYLKNVLLQFLEKKDQRTKMQLLPVLGMILHFDKSDEQKWMAAIR